MGSDGTRSTVASPVRELTTASPVASATDSTVYPRISRGDRKGASATSTRPTAMSPQSSRMCTFDPS
ncbi:hypothetical protein B5808_13615 [Cnuibacter physcomitrellae]|uniref:Uncharacterized protein n=1 Tax=Cnuibacter physcomitrellae TaxID=1619308 RepID=A0A1X9LLU1_9MICO|nr:hypothetical protein B5808_13615 [Cnuibacter physcomitrellae]